MAQQDSIFGDNSASSTVYAVPASERRSPFQRRPFSSETSTSSSQDPQFLDILTNSVSANCSNAIQDHVAPDGTQPRLHLLNAHALSAPASARLLPPSRADPCLSPLPFPKSSPNYPSFRDDVQNSEASRRDVDHEHLSHNDSVDPNACGEASHLDRFASLEICDAPTNEDQTLKDHSTNTCDLHEDFYSRSQDQSADQEDDFSPISSLRGRDSVTPELATSKRELRESARQRDFGFSNLWTDADDSGDYDPSERRPDGSMVPQKRKRLAPGPKAVQKSDGDRSPKKTKAYSSLVARRQSGATFVVTLQITSREVKIF